MRVVVVDDNETLRLALAEALGDRGVEVAAQATDGDEACRIARDLQPDVVVMDIRMPGISGPQATAWLAQHCPGVMVVGLTAYDDQALHQAMMAAGAYKVLVKGASIKQIVSAIAEAGSVPR